MVIIILMIVFNFQGFDWIDCVSLTVLNYRKGTSTRQDGMEIKIHNDEYYKHDPE